ncbi:MULTISPECIES: hypothetical protein [Chitinophaga]|uniref:hypothetical protein n=1 Tax=Chitinophaga TaxID=79328 RepID=UPI0009C9DE19|nr:MULTISPECIES: hypothetical protein [Chitinophaga]OMP76291.1 hypothetical protein BW716_25780 [[Flexibacter] sp. ATCC 35208]WPQ66397.1 hypothetical protein SIO70_16175 [Chitinophaga sancti]WPV64010.1 hypothetical protein QQL36_19605 [Chitinophaga sp. LS1]
MELNLEYNKAIRLLDEGREEEALQLLEKVLLNSMQNDDQVHVVRSSVVLGEYFFNIGDEEAAGKNLERAIEAILTDEEAEELDWELNQARELLNNL